MSTDDGDDVYNERFSRRLEKQIVDENLSMLDLHTSSLEKRLSIVLTPNKKRGVFSLTSMSVYVFLSVA